MQSKVPPQGNTVVSDSLMLSQPQPPVDPLHRPFVGNETIDDNLRENITVAIFNLMGERARALEISVTAGVATLGGPVIDHAEAAGVVKAASSISGISEVVDHLRPANAAVRAVRTRAPRSAARHAAEPLRLVTLTRFCGLDDASTGAAIRQAIGRLDHFFADRRLPQPDRMVIVYRNLIPGAITLELGFPVSPNSSPNLEGEFRFTELPAATDQAATTAPGIAPIIATLRELMLAGHAYAWQVVDDEDFRPWRGHPALPLSVTADS